MTFLLKKKIKKHTYMYEKMKYKNNILIINPKILRLKIKFSIFISNFFLTFNSNFGKILVLNLNFFIKFKFNGTRVYFKVM